MNKARLEAFSDGVFAVVMTLLIFEVKVPVEGTVTSNAQLWQQLLLLWPLVSTYFVSFVVLSAFWINHHFIFASFAKGVDRVLNLINLTYLMFVAFIPFSAQLLGNFTEFQPAAIVYGVNIFIVVLIARVMTNYILHHKELIQDDVSHRLIMQGRFRGTLTLSCYVLGIITSFFSTPLTIFFYAFPVIFNIIPGTVTTVEKIFRFRLE